MAPRFRLIVGSGTMRSASIRCSAPSPLQTGQAPKGALNEKSRGSISGIVKPDTGQANFAEKVMRFGLPSASVSSAYSASAIPSASSSAVSKLSASRAPHVGADRNPVHHDVDVVLVFLVQRRGVGDLVELAVDLEALEAALHELGDLLAVFALAAADHRRQQIEPRAIGQGQHAVDHLAHRLALDRQPGRGRVGDADACEQEPHVIVDFGDGADRRARIFRRRLLLDGDRWRQPVDLVDVRLLHHLQELPRIGRERLDVAALPLGVDRVESQRRFARARQPREDDELVAGDRQIDVLEVVLARAADADRTVEQALDRQCRGCLFRLSRGQCSAFNTQEDRSNV